MEAASHRNEGDERTKAMRDSPSLPKLRVRKEGGAAVRQLEENLGYTFQQKALLHAALTHPSAQCPDDNQRLEFLGDAVLEFCVSDLLYEKYPDVREGDLTARRAALVCEETLCRLAQRMNIGDFLRMSHGEKQQKGHEKPSILADAMEALLAAVYLDGGISAAQKLIRQLFAEEEALAAMRGRDDKGLLQAHTQANGQALPEYQVIEESGPSHEKHFTVQVLIAGKPVATGEGGSKKAAEQAAAKAALAHILQG